MARPRKVGSMLSAARRAQRRVSDWMREHHDEIESQIGDGRVDWRPVLVVVSALQLLDEHGQPASREVTARTWRRIHRDVVAERAEKAAAQARRLGEIAPGVRVIPPFPSAPAWPSPAMLSARTAAPAQSAAAAPPGDASAPSGIPDGRDGATEQIQRALQALGAGRVPMPPKQN